MLCQCVIRWISINITLILLFVGMDLKLAVGWDSVKDVGTTLRLYYTIILCMKGRPTSNIQTAGNAASAMLQ